MPRIKFISKKERILYITGIISGLILTVIVIYPGLLTASLDMEQRKAARCMDEMIAEVSRYCALNSIAIDSLSDPDLTGLIGPEWTEMTSTLGHLDAKRTSIQPDFAALIVRLLKEAGVQRNDTIGLVCSGSFPGLMLASLSAAKALDLKYKILLSLGSSSFGANRPELTIIDIYQILIENNLIDTKPAGVSLGGEQDAGLGWDPDIIRFLSLKISQSEYPFIRAENLQESIKIKAEMLGLEHSAISALINTGGAMANIGTSPSILRVKPGLVTRMKIPPENQQGIIHIAAKNQIPVIHLLYLKGLIVEYRLTWDPAARRSAE